MSIPNNVLYIHRAGFVIAQPSKKSRQYQVYACKKLPENCGKIVSTIFDTRRQAHDWLGVFNVH
jgi:hypothetical protein